MRPGEGGGDCSVEEQRKWRLVTDHLHDFWMRDSLLVVIVARLLPNNSLVHSRGIQSGLHLDASSLLLLGAGPSNESASIDCNCSSSSLLQRRSSDVGRLNSVQLGQG